MNIALVHFNRIALNTRPTLECYLCNTKTYRMASITLLRFDNSDCHYSDNQSTFHSIYSLSVTNLSQRRTTKLFFHSALQIKSANVSLPAASEFIPPT